MSADRPEPQLPAPEPPGGRLSGPDAGWRNMLRNLDGAQAIAAAEAAAHGHDDPRRGLQGEADDAR